jgi:hypothetical protein
MSAKKNKKIMYAITIGATIGIAYIVYTQIRKAKLLREFGDLDTIKNDNKGNVNDIEITGSEDVIQTNQENTDVRPNFDPDSYAQDLYDSMYNGWSFWGYTDEDKLLGTLKKLSCGEIAIVKDYFYLKYGNGETLREWITGDLSGNDLEEALGYVDC